MFVGLRHDTVDQTFSDDRRFPVTGDLFNGVEGVDVSAENTTAWSRFVSDYVIMHGQHFLGEASGKKPQ